MTNRYSTINIHSGTEYPSIEEQIKFLEGCISTFDRIPKSGIPYNSEAAMHWHIIQTLKRYRDND